MCGYYACAINVYAPHALAFLSRRYDLTEEFFLHIEKLLLKLVLFICCLKHIGCLSFLCLTIVLTSKLCMAA